MAETSASSTATPLASLRLRAVFRRTFGLLRRNALLLLVIVPALNWAPGAALHMAGHHGGGAWKLLPVKVSLSLLWLAVAALQASLATSAAVIGRDGASAKLRKSFAMIRVSFAPVLALCVAATVPDLLYQYLLLPTLGASKGGSYEQQMTALLVQSIPLVALGIWSVCVEAFAAPADAVIVAEGRGWIDALVQALRLTRGARFRIAFLAVLWGAFGFTLTMGWDLAATLSFHARGAVYDTMFFGIRVLTETLGSIWIVVRAAIYFELAALTER